MAFEREDIRLPGGVLSYWVAGCGRPIVCVPGDADMPPGDALLRLSQNRKIYVPILSRADDSARQSARRLGGFIDSMIGGACDIIGRSAGCAASVWLAADKPDGVDHLILESPVGVSDPGVVATDDGLATVLGDVRCVTLLLAGTNDTMTTPEHIRLLKSGIRRCYLIYVYDAGHVIAVDQPARFQGVVTDFLTWGEAFLVNRADQRTPSSREAAALA